MIKNYENGVNTDWTLHGVDESWLNLGVNIQVQVSLTKLPRWYRPERGSDEKRKMQEPLWRLTASDN